MELSYDHAGITADELKKITEPLLPYLRELKNATTETSYTKPEHFLHLPHDGSVLAQVLECVAQKNIQAVKHIFLIGIGGSSLGARAVYDVYCTQSAFTARAPRIHFVDTIDPAYLESLPQFIAKSLHTASEFLLVYISKSGTTAESATNFEVVFSLLKNIFGEDETKSRTVVITENASPLAQKAIQESLTLLTIPQTVGGRFSIFSTAGLFPLVAAGVPVHEILASAQNAEENLFSEDITKNPALASAGILLYYLQKKYAIYDLFMFNPALESLGKWYRQLSAESLGKGNALLPEVSVGTTDLHATAQLYLEGPKNRITTMVRFTETSSVTIPQEETLETVQGLAGKTPEAVHAAIYAGVVKAYAEKNIPFTEEVLTTPASCGSFMHAKMIETLLVAHSLNINPFNQPAVEHYKSKTRRLLAE